MSENFWRILSFVLAGILLVSLVVVGVLGYKLASFNKNKTKELDERLAIQQTELESIFQQEKEQTLNEYVSDDVFGNFKFSYPKVWYSNVTQAVGSREELIFLGHPNLIVNNKDNPAYTALRVVVYGENYERKVKDFDEDFKGTEAIISGITGKRYTGEDEESKKQIAFYAIPLRDKTLYVGTDDAKSYQAAFEEIARSFQLNK